MGWLIQCQGFSGAVRKDWALVSSEAGLVMPQIEGKKKGSADES